MKKEKEEKETQSITLLDIYKLVENYGGRFDTISQSVGRIDDRLEKLIDRFGPRLERLVTLVEIWIAIEAGLLVTFLGILITLLMR